MIAKSRAFSLLDQAAAVHQWHCASLAAPVEDQPAEVNPCETDEAVMRYGLGARAIYGDIKRVVAQAGGLLILAQASARRDAFDMPSLSHAEDLCRDASDRLAGLSAPGRLAAHHDRLTEAASIAMACLRQIRSVRLDADRDPALGAASSLLSRAYAVLQSTSDSRFGMMMVDFRHACCSCGAIKQ